MGTWGLNFYLLEPHIKSPKDALDGLNGLTHRTIKKGKEFTGDLYVKFGDAHPPSWSKFVQGNLSSDIDFPESESTSAVLLVRTSKGYYAYTFGVAGRTLLKRDAFVPDFGKKVALSIVDPDDIRSVDLRTVRAESYLTRHQAPHGVRMRAFGVDTLQDYLRAAAGVPNAKHKTLAKNVVGADSLAYRAEMSFNDLGSKSDKFLKAYESKAYQKIDDFKWIDYITLVRSENKIDELDDLMLEEVRNSRFDFAPAEMIDWGRNPSFALAPTVPAADRLPSMSPQILIDEIGEDDLDDLTTEQLEALKIYCFYDDEAEPHFKWSAYECIELDLKDHGTQYVFAGGRWSEIATDFLSIVNTAFKKLNDGGPKLPDASLNDDVNDDGNLDEGTYITRVVGGSKGKWGKIHLVEKLYVQGVEVELCDIYDSGGSFMHLKIWRGSQGFSALAMQAANAAESLMRVPSFLTGARKAVARLGAKFGKAIPDGFNPREYTVLMGLIRREKGDIPFFSQLTLMRAAERIDGTGLRPAFSVIQVN